MSVEAEARRLSAAVDRLEGESLEVLAALGLPEDTEHEEVLAHIRALVVALDAALEVGP